MKALVSLVLAIALIGGIYVATTSGCGARAQVAGDKLMDKIDNWLGELDVKQKKIENEIESLDETIKKNHEGKIKAEVRLEEFDKRITPIEKNVGRVKQALIVILRTKPLRLICLLIMTLVKVGPYRQRLVIAKPPEIKVLLTQFSVVKCKIWDML